MIYILLTLIVLTTFAENISINDNNIPQWFLVKQGNFAKYDKEVISKFGLCTPDSPSYILKYHNVTHCLVETYSDTNCVTLLGTTYYWKGQNIEDVDTYIRENGYYSITSYSDPQCNTPIQYFVYTKEHCNYEVNFNTGEILYSWFDIQGNKLKYCNIDNTVTSCTEEMKQNEHCQLYDIEQCKDYSKIFINYDKLDNSIPPMSLLVVFSVLMLFL